MSDADAARAALHAKFATSFVTAMKLKKVMLKRGLTAARAVCPSCGAMLQGRLVGPRNHLRMWCEGAGCTTTAME